MRELGRTLIGSSSSSVDKLYFNNWLVVSAVALISSRWTG